MQGLVLNQASLMSQPPFVKSQSAFVRVADRFGLVPIPLAGEVLDAKWLGNKLCSMSQTSRPALTLNRVRRAGY